MNRVSILLFCALTIFCSVDGMERKTEHYNCFLLIAIKNGHSANINSLLKNKKVDLTYKEPGFGNTPLHIVAGLKSSPKKNRIFRLLVQAGAPINIQNNHLATPLTILLLSDDYNREHLDLIEYCLQCKNIKLDLQMRNGLSYMHLAQNHSIRILLAKYGVPLNKKDTIGWTPLHYRCWLNDLDGIQTLLALGAHLSIKNFSGEKPNAHIKNEHVKKWFTRYKNKHKKYKKNMHKLIEDLNSPPQKKLLGKLELNACDVYVLSRYLQYLYNTKKLTPHKKLQLTHLTHALQKKYAVQKRIKNYSETLFNYLSAWHGEEKVFKNNLKKLLLKKKFIDITWDIK